MTETIGGLMKLVQVRLSNFRCFGPKPTVITFADTTFVLGPNGAGKTTVLQALARMFSIDPTLRRIKAEDFHVPAAWDDNAAPVSKTLWIEADFQFPELKSQNPGKASMPAVASHFAQLTMADTDKVVRLRIRLNATLDEDGEIEERCAFVTKVDDHGEPLEAIQTSKQDRNRIQVHYLPARRNPADHISISANALIGRALRAANWKDERETIAELTGQISDALAGNAAITGIDKAMERLWRSLHKGDFYASPSVSFARSDVDNLLRHLSISFTPGHGETTVDFSRLSDGQQSLLYVSLVLAMHDLGQSVLAGKLSGFDVDKLRPASFTLLAVEEPENSLSPHYLGRVVKALESFAKGQDSQAVVATHAPALLRRVEPEAIRYLRLDKHRCTLVSSIVMPQKDADARKFVREAVRAFPELYFSRFVILGEGDSEEIVLPRLLSARGVLADDASVSVVPLGGRHVNHFWRLLHGLGIPHATVLDLDLSRHHAGWWRIRYAANELLEYADIKAPGFSKLEVAAIPAWDAQSSLMSDDEGWIDRLENEGVFFSTPLDLDFMMLECFTGAYGVTAEELRNPSEGTTKAVLGKSHDAADKNYTPHQLTHFDAYVRLFKRGSKPVSHVQALADLTDDELKADMPEVLQRLILHVDTALAGLPE